MSQLGTLHVSPQTVASAVWAVVDADATLQGATYLTGTGRVHIGKPPEKAPRPLCSIVAGEGFPNPNDYMYLYTFDVMFRAANVGSGSEEDPLLGRCAERVATILAAGATLSKSGFRFFEVILEAISPVRPSPETPQESEITVRFNVNAVKLDL